MSFGRRAPGADEVLPQVVAVTVDGVLSWLAGLGLVRAWTLWKETAGEAYLSDGRILTAVLVPARFVLSSPDDGGRVRAGSEEPGRNLAHAARAVPAGWYLVAEVGDVAPSVAGVAGIDPAAFCRHLGIETSPEQTAEGLTAWISEDESFGASHCHAGCAGCGGRWYAEAGSWHFTPEASDGVAWDFDDADGFNDDGTIACRACGTGRVGFCIC